MSDTYQRGDTMGTVWAIAPMLRWLRRSLHERADAPEADARLVRAAVPLLARLGASAVPASAEALFDVLSDVVPGVAAGMHGVGADEAGRLLADVEQCLHGIGPALADICTVTGEGAVEGVFVSDGGVPKRPVERVEVGPRGLEGDRQASRRHHGKPMQALCLYSSEVIAELRGEGHPIAPGAAGENVVIRGLEWSSLRPFLRLRIGTVLAELSAPATPCAKNARWFVDGDIQRMDHDLHPGSSRWYAWVLEGGEVGIGDVVVLSPGQA